jgi:small conductance mechanosensitive channel
LPLVSAWAQEYNLDNYSIRTGEHNMIDTLMPYVMSFANAIFIGVIGYLIAFIVYKLLEAALTKSLGKSWAVFVGRIAWIVVIALTFKVILDQTGATGVVVVLVTALTGALAIGSEGLAADLVAGLILFFTKPFEIKDYVAIGDYEGKVININTSFTELNCYDGTRITLRNATVLNNTIINYSKNPGVRVETMIPIPLTEDLEKAVEVMYEALRTYEPQARETWFKAHVNMAGVNYGYAEFKVRVFIPLANFGEQRMLIFLHIMRALKEAGISTKA